MSQLSDDESSDSSNEYLVPADKIDLNSSFFSSTAKKVVSKNAQSQNLEDSDEDFDCYDEENVSSAELLSQVLKNLENAKSSTYGASDSQQESSTSLRAAQNDPLVGSKEDQLAKEINDLLYQGESAASLAKHEKDDGSEDESRPEHQKNYVIPQEGVKVHLPGENLVFDKKKKKQQDLQKVLQNKINQRIRKTQVYVHKVGLLTCLAHGFYLNKVANDPELLGIALSLVSPSDYPSEKPDIKYLQKFTRWFGGIFKIFNEHKTTRFSSDSLLQCLSEKKIHNYVELCLLYVATVRGMGIPCRIVISLQPPPLKPTQEQLFKVPNDESNSSGQKMAKSSETKKSRKSINKAPAKKGKGSRKKTLSPEKPVPTNSREALKTANSEARKKAAAILKEKFSPSSPSKCIKNRAPKESMPNTSSAISSITSNSSSPIKTKTDFCSDHESIEEDHNLSIAEKLSLKLKRKGNAPSSKDKLVCKNEKTELSKKRKHRASSGDGSSDESDESEFSTDDEFVKKKPKIRPIDTSKTKSAISKFAYTSKNHRKVLSSDDENPKPNKQVYNLWVEVYLESEKSWISVNVMDQRVHCVADIYKKAGAPVLYIIAWNMDDSLKDVTRRYCPHWMTDTRKKRVEEKWWKETLSVWEEKKTAISKAEDEQLLQRELEQPLPKSVSECKGHPLYVLVRHLLKFEALYPPDAVPLGHLKTGEAIYSRYCVHTLYSRETWVRRARVVKPAQEPYKIVKSMPKYDKLSGMKIKDQPLELFGKWQTTPYEPPEAKDGIVPRNEYGNVDLFQMCMLPKGCSYINLPALSRIARKLNIDCAPACVGFNFGGRGALPAFEGFVVCSEYEDTLRDAWEQEQIDSQKRNKEKREKRIYGNWKKLIKGLLIKQKLAAKYNFDTEEQGESEEENEIHPSKVKAIFEKKNVKTIKKYNPEKKAKGSEKEELKKKDSETNGSEMQKSDRLKSEARKLEARKSDKQRSETASSTKKNLKVRDIDDDQNRDKGESNSGEEYIVEKSSSKNSRRVSKEVKGSEKDEADNKSRARSSKDTTSAKKATNVATRSSKRNKQEPGPLPKKTRR
ncbi:hypothetical protein QAD02_012445 [Eretmocerus hayati]|uniref:Uncharacterized protein n=1 Tax=Eretmocerus hayati TaxID=131215 RepID=A0ACC2NZR8_9HYME|nr:hypothetical protein QAD02_012445 [Eretmocerus hayati]